MLAAGGHRGANDATRGNAAVKSGQVWVTEPPVGNLDGKMIGGVASASLRDERDVPAAVVDGVGRGDINRERSQYRRKNGHTRSAA